MAYISKKQILITFIIMLVIGMVLFGVYLNLSQNRPQENVEAGYYTFDYNDAPVFLNGEWEFAWNKLAFEEKVESAEQYVYVPSMWTFYKDQQGKSYPSYGTAVYALTIGGLQAGENIAFRFPTFGTSANVYADGKLIHQVGVVSKSKEKYKPQYKVEYVTYTSVSSEADLKIEVSNYSYSRGGIWLPILIGSQSSINSYMIKKASYDYFLLGVFFIIFFVGITLIILRPKDQSVYYFIAFIVLFVLYNISSGDKIILRWFENLSMNTIVRVQYFTMSLLPFIWFRYLKFLDAKVYSTYFYIIMGAQSLFLSVFSMFAPIPILTTTTYYGNALIIAYMILSVFGSILLIMKHNKNAIVYLACTCIVGISGLHDVLYGNTMIHSNFEVFGAGYMISLLALGVLITYKATRDMEKAKYSKMYEQAYLNAQIKPHFLFNTLNTISSFINTDSKKALELNFYLAQFLRSTINADNLKSTIPLSKEIENTKAYVNIEEARFSNLSIDFYMDNMEGIFIPPLTLQPLIENAIKHGLSERKGEKFVTVSGEIVDNGYKITVYDNGVGIDTERLEDIECKLNKIYSKETHDDFGIGLINVNRRLKEYLSTQLVIESKQDEYTSISFKIY